MPGRLFRVHGRVQGVGFRGWTRSQARRLGVAGCVRNAPDGTVEVRARAPEEALAELRRLLHKGPPVASVARVEEQETEEVPDGEFEVVN